MVSVREIVALECNLQVSVSQQKEKENALAQYWATSFSLQSELVSVRISYSPKFNIFLKNKNVDSQTGVELDAEQCPTMQKWSHFRMAFADLIFVTNITNIISAEKLSCG